MMEIMARCQRWWRDDDVDDVDDKMTARWWRWWQDDDVYGDVDGEMMEMVAR